MNNLLDREKSIKTRQAILDIEGKLKKLPGAMQGDSFPLRHSFVDGAYVREIFMPKGMLITSKIHKVTHPFFILEGEVSVLNSEEGRSVKLKAPYYGVTPAGTKRVLYIHENTRWVTVHVTKETDVERIEEEIIAKSYEEIELSKEELTLKEGAILCLG